MYYKMVYIDQIRFIEYLKMDKMDAVDNITKNIVREIIRELKSKRNVTIEEEFCLYFVRLLTFDPKWGISPECQLNRDNISKFVKYCIEQLANKDSPYIKTLVMQHAWLSQPQNRIGIISHQRDLIREKLRHLRQDIVEFVIDDQSLQGQQRLIHKVVVYIILSSGLGSPKEPDVMRDVYAALSSIYNDVDMKNFSKHSPSLRSNELKQVTDIVTGIRIFNEKTGNTYAGILEFHASLKDAVKTSYSEGHKFLAKIMERINILTHLIEKQFKLIYSKSSGHYVLEKEEQSDIDEDYISLLIAYRQHELFLRKLLMKIEDIKRNVIILIDVRFVDTINALLRIVRNKLTIPATKVFPLFCLLTYIASKVQDEAILLAKYNKNLTCLVALIKEIKYDSRHFKKLVKGETVLSDTARLERTNHLHIIIFTVKVAVLHASNIDLKKIKLEYLGFCPWFIVETNGGLMPGNPNMGILYYKSRHYICSCLEAAESFCANPERYILQILDVARVRTELVHLLQLYRPLLSVRDIPNLYQKPLPKIPTLDSAVQTELHPIESNIDKNYTWNVWDLYRDAVHWATITNCQTHSTQTIQSHFRSPARVQTTEYRNKLMQTKTDNYSNVPTLSNFIYGLRGKCDNPHVIELTRPVDE